MSYNAGFARANNEGIRHASGETVLLLNSDTIVIDNAVIECYKAFSTSSYVACGVQLLNPDGSPQISGNYFMKGSLNNLLPLPVIGPLIKSAGSFLKVKKPHIPHAEGPVEVDWINGAFLMVKKNVISKGGMLDEDFFLYAEEAEWCYRLKKFGKLVIYGQFNVIHLQGESSKPAFTSTSHGYTNLYDKKGLQIMLSNFVRIRKQNGIGWFILHLIIFTFDIPVFFVAVIISHLFSLRKMGSKLNHAVNYTRNIFQIWSYFQTILLNKPFFYKIL